MIKLSIIIPCYNSEPYIHELLDCLNNQITDEVEVLIIDDGSDKRFSTDYSWAKVFRQKNGGVSSARNKGLDKAIGQYICFIDSDDLVSENYVEKIIEKIDTENFDYLYLSWETLSGGWQSGKKILSLKDKYDPWNCCVWTRVYRKSIIGNIRFNTAKKIAEDAQFIREVDESNKKKSFISDYLYFYRSNTENSLTKRFANGEIDMPRTVYYYKKITKDMDYLLDEIKALDKSGEVIVMTHKNEIPELSNYALVLSPTPIKGTELRGEKTSLFQKIEKPMKTQVIIYTKETFDIGGIETFIYNFCMNLKDDYDIIVLYDKMSLNQIERLEPFVMVKKNDIKQKIICDTLIINRISDEVPSNISYKKKIQMVHCCKLNDSWKVNLNSDNIIAVSNEVKKSFELPSNKTSVINNFTYSYSPKKILKLVSATRLSFEKGENRIIKLAELLNKNEIPFVWFIFSERPLKKNIPGIIYMNPTLDVINYFNMADYVVQLSDSEAFGYSIIESLEVGTPIITTPIPVLEELGFIDGKHGFYVPFDMENIDIEKIYNSTLKFEYNYDNSTIFKKWKKILGDTIPKKDYVYEKKEHIKVKIRITSQYYSTVLKRDVFPGEKFIVDKERADLILSAKKCKIER